MLRSRAVLLLGLLGVLVLSGAAAADIFRGRFRVGRYTTVEQGGQMSWSQISAQAGLRTAVEMSSLADIQTGGFGTTAINYPDQISYDATKGAMKIFVPASWGTGAVHWRKQLPWADSFTDGDDMWVQFDVMWDVGMLTLSNGGGGIKVASIDEGIQSTGELSGHCNNGGTYPMDGQIVLHRQHASNLVARWYHACEYYYGLENPLPFGDVWFQNKFPNCRYHTINVSGDAGCFTFVPNVWHTFTLRVKIGTMSANWPPGVPDSQVDFWGSYSGQTAASYIHSQKNWGLRNLSPGQGRYGTLWLLPYDTNRINSTVDGNVWYRRILIGSQPLKDPTSGLTLVPDGATPPGDPYPSTLTASYLGVTGQDKVGQGQTVAPNGVNDFHVSVAGLRGTPTRIRITNQGTSQSGTWEFPANAINWLVAAEYGGGGANTADFWFEPWQESLTHVKVFYADGSTDEADATTPGLPSTHTLTVQKTGTGTVSSSVPSGAISCGGDCAETIANGTAFTMSATPGANYIFSGWQGGGCSGTGACSLTLNANTSVTAVFASTITPGNLASIPNNGWLEITPAPSNRYSVSGNISCGGQVLVSDQPEVNGINGTSSPVNKGYTGIAAGGGKVLYWGGGHGLSGNSVEMYNPQTNAWRESWKPEVCTNPCDVCGAIYGGSTSPARTLLNRPYGEQAYHYNAYNPLTGLWHISTRGVGPWIYNEAAQTITYRDSTVRADGFYYPWPQDVGYLHAFFAPDLGDVLTIITASGAPIGIWRLNDFSTTPPKWAIVGPWGPTNSWDSGTPHSTYVTSQGRHLFTMVGIDTGTQCASPRKIVWLHTPTMAWSSDVTMPADMLNISFIEYDSLHDKLLAINDCTTPPQIWVGTTANTPVWTPLAMTAAVPGNTSMKVYDVTTVNPSIQFDPINNVFWYIHVANNGPVKLWAYRLQN